MSCEKMECYVSQDPNVLFNEAILKRVDCSECSFTSNHGLSYPTVGPNLLARPLERTDYDKGYIALLSQLTKVGDYNKEKYETQFDAMKLMCGCHYIVVVEDTTFGKSGKVVANATLSVERKFIHNAATRGRIEDVVVDKEYRSLHLGSFLLEFLSALSRELCCYKVSLDCKTELEGFYKKYGYVNEGQCFMTLRFYD